TLVLADRQAAIHPSGSFCAYSIKAGVALYCLGSGQQVGFLPLPESPNGGVPAICFDGAGALLTNSSSGLLRWPVRPDALQPGKWALGPPERLPFFPGIGGISASRDSRVVLQCMWGGYGMSQHA